MKTIKENVSLSEEEKMKRLEEAKGSKLYKGWKPYCMICDYRERMESMPYGFKCPKCGNIIGFDLERLKESPLNNMDRETAVWIMKAFKRRITHPFIHDLYGSIRWMNDEFVDGNGNHINRRNMLDILISPKFREGWKII